MANKNDNTEVVERGFLKKPENWWIIVGVIVVLIAIGTPFLILFKLGWHLTYHQFEKIGVVGDYFGGTTVGLFTLASILFVIATIVMQKEELKMQRIELSQTRKEYETGNNTAKVQQIDNAFYNMLSLLHQIVNNIEISVDYKIKHTGRKAFVNLSNTFQYEFAQKDYLNENPDKGFNDWLSGKTAKKYMEEFFGREDTISQQTLDEYYEDFHRRFGNDIGHYMRFNYRIVKFIVSNVAENEKEQKEISEKTGRETIIADRRYYLGLLRAQWSNAEFELILINSLYSENRKFKDLILKYDVLDIEITENKSDIFKLKDSMNKFKAYRKLIEVKK